MISLAPGPVPAADFVRRKLGEPLPHHRTQEFRDLFAVTGKRLGSFFSTNQPVLTITTSGTGAMEAVSQNLVRANEPVLVLVNGVYGEQWVDINTSLGFDVDVLRYEPGRCVRIDDVKSKLSSKKYTAVFVQACETSTGILNPIREISELSRNLETLCLVDACSALGAVPLEMDQWGIDVLLTSSQKVLMSPPGLAFVCLSEKAWTRCQKPERTTYFDLRAELESIRAQGMTRFTPGVASFVATAEVLRQFELDSTLLARYRSRMSQIHAVCMRIAKQCGLSNFADVSCPTVAAIRLPPSLDGVAIREFLLRTRNIFVLGGFGVHTKSVVRMGLMGSVSNSDLHEFWLGFIDASREQGFEFNLNRQEIESSVRSELSRLGPEVWNA